uniref:Uncharacterized protein n=1 Tax=Vespula pensylvanica TaxID=30213 RepID=A0A834UBV1_VESPE|nr:hypothetical protein H0235_006059 [Vespula pensylvanica]
MIKRNGIVANRQWLERTGGLPRKQRYLAGEAKREESIHARTSGLYEGNVVVLVEMERVKGGEEKRAEKQSHDGRVRRGAEDEVREESYDAAQLAVRIRLFLRVQGWSLDLQPPLNRLWSYGCMVGAQAYGFNIQWSLGCSSMNRRLNNDDFDDSSISNRIFLKLLTGDTTISIRARSSLEAMTVMDLDIATARVGRG